MRSISVVIATYNRKNLLLKCIDSVISQKYPNKKLEIIVIDDASSDGTRDAVLNLAKRHKNIRILSHEKNKGEAGARNTGIKAARNDIISFIDDDCIALNGWLSSINKSFEKGIEGVEGMAVAKGRKGPFDNYVENTKGGKYMTCNMSYLAPFIKKIGCDERLKHANRVDTDLAFSVMEKKGNIMFEKKAVVEHSVVKSGFMSKLRKKKFFMNDALLYKKHPGLYKKEVRFPFEKFTPFYILFVALSIISPFMLLGIPITSLVEIYYRKWNIGLQDFAKFAVLQAIGSFVIIASVIYGCHKYRTSLKIFVP